MREKPKRDPRISPRPGDLLCHPKRGTLRQVTKIDDDGRIVYYVSQSIDGKKRSESIYYWQWVNWCKVHKIEVVNIA